MAPYQIFADVTADICEEMFTGLPVITFIPMRLEIGGREYEYGPYGDISVPEFYALQQKGDYATTSQINPSTYRAYFEPVLKSGMDILYLCFSSGMSGCYQSALACIQELQEEYPEREILCVDTLCGSVGGGFLVREAARLQKNSLSLEELFDWTMEHRLEVCHWFTVDVFAHLKHGGRVSTASAALGTVLQIKPLLHITAEGKLEVVEKPRGRKKAIDAQLSRMLSGWKPQMGELVVIGHGDNPEGAGQLRDAVQTMFPSAEIYIAPIGPVIGAHTGPGMLALIYWGSNR